MLYSLKAFVLLGKLSVSYNLVQTINLSSQAYLNNMNAQLDIVSFNSMQKFKNITLMNFHDL